MTTTTTTEAKKFYITVSNGQTRIVKHGFVLWLEPTKVSIKPPTEYLGELVDYEQAGLADPNEAMGLLASTTKVRNSSGRRVIELHSGFSIVEISIPSSMVETGSLRVEFNIGAEQLLLVQWLTTTPDQIEQAYAHYGNLSPAVIEEALNIGSLALRMRIAGYTDDATVLTRLADDEHHLVRQAVARNRNTPDVVLVNLHNDNAVYETYMYEDENGDIGYYAYRMVHKSLAENPSTPIELLEHLYEGSCPMVSEIAGTHPVMRMVRIMKQDIPANALTESLLEQAMKQTKSKEELQSLLDTAAKEVAHMMLEERTGERDN